MTEPSTIKMLNVEQTLTRATVSTGSNNVNLFRFKLFTCSNTKLKCSTAVKQSLSRSEVTTSY